MSLQDPTKKMSKSDENEKNFVSIIDDAKKIEKKIKSAATDSDTVVTFDVENKPGLANLLTIYSVLSGKTTDELVKEYEGKMYGHVKGDLAGLVVDTFAPIKAEYDKLMQNRDHLNAVMKDGARRAQERAVKTLDNAYKTTGLVRL